MMVHARGRRKARGCGLVSSIIDHLSVELHLPDIGKLEKKNSEGFTKYKRYSEIYFKSSRWIDCNI